MNQDVRIPKRRKLKREFSKGIEKRHGFNKRLIITLLLSGIMVAGVFLFLSYQEPNVKEIDVSFQGFEERNPVFQVNVKIYNPNILGATVVGGEVKLYVEETYTGTVTPTEEIYIPPHSETVVPLKFVLAHIPLPGGNPVEVKAVGEVEVKVSIFTFHMPVEKTEYIWI